MQRCRWPKSCMVHSGSLRLQCDCVQRVLPTTLLLCCCRLCTPQPSTLLDWAGSIAGLAARGDMAGDNPLLALCRVVAVILPHQEWCLPAGPRLLAKLFSTQAMSRPGTDSRTRLSTT